MKIRFWCDVPGRVTLVNVRPSQECSRVYFEIDSSRSTADAEEVQASEPIEEKG